MEGYIPSNSIRCLTTLQQVDALFVITHSNFCSPASLITLSISFLKWRFYFGHPFHSIWSWET